MNTEILLASESYEEAKEMANTDFEYLCDVTEVYSADALLMSKYTIKLWC